MGEQKCTFYLIRKQRNCKFDAINGQLYCGNHLFLVTNVGSKRVPCPVDPRHTIAECELEQHVPKCPKYLENQRERARTHFQEDINGGSSDESIAGGTSGTSCGGLAAARCALVASWTEQTVAELMLRIELAHKRLAAPEACCCSYVAGTALAEALPGPKKHTTQNAQILGAMHAAGLLPPSGRVLVEVGAGKAFLAAAAAAIYTDTPPEHIVVLDCRSCFKHKADRLMRHLGLSRLAVDLKDWDPLRTQALSSRPRTPWLMMGKHLCGAATDYALRAAARTSLGIEQQTRSGESATAVLPQGRLASTNMGSTKAALPPMVATSGTSWPFLGAPSQVAPTRTPQAAPAGAPQAELAEPTQQGTPEKGTVSSCLAGSGNCGETSHAPVSLSSSADCEPQILDQQGSAPCPDDARGMSLALQDEKSAGVTGPLLGLAIAPCCHHRCTWRAYTGKPFLTALGFSPAEFEVMSWMSGWALCGHGSRGEEGDGASESDDEDVEQEGGVQCRSGNAERQSDLNTSGADEAVTRSKSGSQAAAASVSPPALFAHPSATSQYVANIPRARRMEIGAMCKALIDEGRRQWLSHLVGWSQTGAVLQQYVPASISGENKILIATTQALQTSDVSC